MWQVPWYVTALGAALVWGIHYPLVDHALKRLSLASVLVLGALPILAVMALFRRALAADVVTLAGMSWAERLPILALAFTSFAGMVLVYDAISGKNATLASLIEISYPVFVALFAFLLFREFQLTPPVVLGAALVFAGVAIIVFYGS